jgi:hypothetical protein
VSSPLADPQLLLLDCSGIQDYVFGSSRMADNVGASHLVAAALDELVRATLTGELQVSPPDWHTASGVTVGTVGGAEVEVLYVGGGNAALLFASESLAHRFLRAYGHRVFSVAPGLRVAAALVSWQPGQLETTLEHA